MTDLTDIEGGQRQIEDMINHYSQYIRFLIGQLIALNNDRLERAEKRLVTLEKELESAAISQEALEWWPFLKILVQNINRAAIIRDVTLLENALIEGINIQGMKIEHQALREARVVTVAGLKKDLRSALRDYKVQLKDIMVKRKRIKNPIGKRGQLKKTTLKQYHSIVKKWPEKQAQLKAEIQKLNADMKAMKFAKRLDFSNGMVLTVHRGGQCPVRMPRGPFAKAQKS